MMDGVRLMSLGMFVFGIPTLAFDELVRKASYRHVTSARVGVRDATQFTGPGEETITIAGTVYTEIADGEASLSDLHSMACTGDPWPLLDGTGRIYGAFVITAVDERRRRLHADGSARAIDFGIDLLRVDDAVE